MELCCVQLPGREGRLAEAAFTRIQPMVQAAAEVLLPFLDRPFAFYGHSLGALVSFELTRMLGEQYGITPLHLFVSGHDAPHLIPERTSIHTLPDTAFVDELKRINGTPPEVFAHPDLMALLLPILRADFEAAETYAYHRSAPVRCPISALGGLQDDYVSIERLKAWQDHTSCDFFLHMFPGGHFYLHAHRGSLLEIIIRTLQRYL
jgi:medium-chain acyl-[acyl-carrier-protein] hydrolase